MQMAIQTLQSVPSHFVFDRDVRLLIVILQCLVVPEDSHVQSMRSWRPSSSQYMRPIDIRLLESCLVSTLLSRRHRVVVYYLSTAFDKEKENPVRGFKWKERLMLG